MCLHSAAGIGYADHAGTVLNMILEYTDLTGRYNERSKTNEKI